MIKGAAGESVHVKMTIDKSKKLITEMEEVFQYIKYGYRSSIGKDACPSHSIEHALRIDGGKLSQEVTCPQTWAIFAWFEKLKTFFALNEPCRKIVTELVEKIVIYMGHILRTEVQQRRINDIDTKHVLVKKGSTHAKLILDFKMKLNPCECQEAGIMHYGKRGISFHGTALIFVNDAGEREIHWLGTVIQGDAKQNAGMTIAVTEDVIARAAAIVPDRITTFTLQSDNASNYQNHLYVLMMRELCPEGFMCTRVLHTESQDGKCIVDGHFQKVGWQIAKFVVETKGRCQTANQICDALEYKGGIPGSSLTCLRLDREKLTALENRVKAVKFAAERVFTVNQCLEVRFTIADEPDTMHATSYSPPAKVLQNAGQQSKRLVAHLQAHTVRLKLAYLEALQHAAKTKPVARAEGVSKRQRTGQHTARSRPSRPSQPQGTSEMTPATPGETDRIRSLVPGAAESQIRMQWSIRGRWVFYAGTVEGWHTGDLTGKRLSFRPSLDPVLHRESL